MPHLLPAVLALRLVTGALAPPSAAEAPGPAPTVQPAALPTVPASHGSVYRIDPFLDGALVLAAALTITVPYLFGDEWVDRRCPCNPAEVNAFDRPAIGNHSRAAAVASDVTVGIAVLGPTLADALALQDRVTFLEDATVLTQAVLVSGAFVSQAKYTVQRPLPRTYAGDPLLIRSARGYRSFYSGHTSTVMAALTVASMTYVQRHGPSVWPWLMTGAVTASVALERVAAGNHFYTDVMVGAGAGLFVGYFTARLHDRKGVPALAFVPAPGGGAGLALAGRL